MKIVTWNCNGALRKKYPALSAFNADLLIVQECEDPAQSTKAYAEWAGNYLWTGESKNKGIGVFAKNGVSVEKLYWPNDGLQQFLPCRVNDQFNLLAVWAMQANSSVSQYIGQFWKYLKLNRVKIVAQNTVICGDFNSNVVWDKKYKWSNHGEVVEELEGMGLYNVYHQSTDEGQGQEKIPTFFMQRKRERPYHIDYAFVSNVLLSDEGIEVGHPDQWIDLSDHMPIVFTVSVDADSRHSDEERALLRKKVWTVLPNYEGQYKFDNEDSGTEYTQSAIMKLWKKGLSDGDDQRKAVLLLHTIMFHDRMNSESGNFEYIDDHKVVVDEILRRIS